MVVTQYISASFLQEKSYLDLLGIRCSSAVEFLHRAKPSYHPFDTVSVNPQLILAAWLLIHCPAYFHAHDNCVRLTPSSLSVQQMDASD